MPAAAPRAVATPPPVAAAAGTAIGVLSALSLCHLLNDLLQSLLPAVYPILKTNLHLDFAHVGLITFVNSGTASVLQPLVGHYTDRKQIGRAHV